MKETVAQNYNQRKSRKNNGSKIEYVIVEIGRAHV